mmetsp:Transcript_24532/g.52026  ORF Transcript_24532/g.52026 Transcript_24532/m.52026 type:complete len:411 (+) Transcript_24532:183-1415(+)|eukprot:CAMPEP_0183719774 /NCGR_PEP_ID=MMETSP0737-20130205/12578_1 /TAXON_ID=385413 /ORGANISM="Thalassiosira miniscula, Strain CCMP1093" /LENGTH=410 /DNA_ID=CAMNT_0025949523 /DNA_START=113 /DNA_END=1345 /DNA_ORIENTATION=-
MGFRSMLKKIEAEATKEVEKYLSSVTSTTNQTQSAKPPKSDPANPPTRWEKAIFAMNGIVAQVSQIDPDGVDVVCFPGSGGGEGGRDYDIYRNLKDTKGLEALVTATPPRGDCKMGEAMDVVLKEAFQRGFDERPCTVLVLTAGRPSDHEALSKSLADAAKKVNKDADLTITFVQVGDDKWAENYLRQLDTELTTTSATGEHIDIVDTIKDEDVQKAVEEMKSGGKSSGMTGGIIGAFAGAAMGAGGVYLANKISKDKRTKGWNGQWKCIYDGDEMCVLDVKDDGEGNLEISGWQEEEVDTTLGSYAENDEGGFNIQHGNTGNENDLIIGTIEDEHTIVWDDGTRWEEIPPENMHWAAYAGAAVAGAGAAGATGYLLEKKFFNKASNNVKSDYVIVLDRSAMMAVPDTGK